MTDHFKGLSIVIPNKDNFERLQYCINLILKQKFEYSYEIIIADGNSSKNYPSNILSNIKIKIINLQYESNQEARKYLALKYCKYELICLLDSDNFLEDINDLNKLVFPLINRDTVASFTMKYSYSNKTNSLNRYFSLLGGYDPIVNFLKKNDRIGFNESVPPKSFYIISENETHFVTRINYNYPPVIGANGFVFKKKIINKKLINPIDFNHNEFFLEIFFLQPDYKLALTKSSLLHSTSDNFYTFFIKKFKNIRNLNTLNNSTHKYKVFNYRSLKDILNLIRFILYTISLISLIESIYNMLRTRKKEWLWHFPVCIIYLFLYSLRCLIIMIKKK